MGINIFWWLRKGRCMRLRCIEACRGFRHLVMKTSISIDDRLLREADETARMMGASRSRLFALAGSSIFYNGSGTGAHAGSAK